MSISSAAEENYYCVDPDVWDDSEMAELSTQIETLEQDNSMLTAQMEELASDVHDAIGVLHKVADALRVVLATVEGALSALDGNGDA